VKLNKFLVLVVGMFLLVGTLGVVNGISTQHAGMLGQLKQVNNICERVMELNLGVTVLFLEGNEFLFPGGFR